MRARRDDRARRASPACLNAGPGVGWIAISGRRLKPEAVMIAMAEARNASVATSSRSHHRCPTEVAIHRPRHRNRIERNIPAPREAAPLHGHADPAF
ncbi:hypothetical protein CNO08_00220 [Lysobacter capsici]|nr:hypothetical protein CNO08_00220 [Lysobacter capsici]